MKVTKLVLGPSIIQTFLSCRMKFLYELFAPEQQERDLDPLNSGMDWGTAFHALCANHDRGLPFVSSGYPTIDKRFEEYLEHTKDDCFEVLDVEKPLLRQLSDVVWMGGTADKIIAPNTILDYKTSGSVTEIGGIGNRDGDQLIHYLWANGWEEGIGIIDQISQAALKNPSATSIKFNRLTRTIDRSDVADWKARMEVVTTEMVRTIEAQDGHLWKNKKTCTDFFKLCYFKPACDMRVHNLDVRSLTNSHFSITLE
jgi:hypothetical protein